MLAPDETLRRVRAAQGIKQVEARAVSTLDGGGTLSDCLNLREHEAALIAGEPSTLRFLT